MMSQEAFEEKRERRIEHFERMAEKCRHESQSAQEHSSRMADAIPFGQPILVGHHSEKRHRRDIERIQNAMTKSIELAEKAQYYEDRLESAQNNSVISSDDPNAIIKLKEKLAGLEAQREKIKEFNKNARKNKTDSAPSYLLRNLAGNIKNVKERIVRLERLAQVKSSEETINGVIVKVNTDENRIQVIFPSIPSESVRNELKGNGFHWSPYNKAWQRMISRWALDVAKKIAGGKDEEI